MPPPRWKDWGAAVGTLTLRLGVGCTMLLHGLPKLEEPQRFVEVVERREIAFPILLGWAAILAETVGALLIAVGLVTRLAALSLAVTMGVAFFYVHAGRPFVLERELPLLFLVGSLSLVCLGGGRLSLDAAIAWFVRRRALRPSAPLLDPASSESTDASLAAR